MVIKFYNQKEWVKIKNKDRMIEFISSYGFLEFDRDEIDLIQYFSKYIGVDYNYDFMWCAKAGCKNCVFNEHFDCTEPFNDFLEQDCGEKKEEFIVVKKKETLINILRLVASGGIPSDLYDEYLGDEVIGFMTAYEMLEYLKGKQYE